MKLEFTKMEGLGNDYVYVDVDRLPLTDPEVLVLREEGGLSRLCDRHFGIGADGLVLIGRSPRADFSMRMFNADGSEGMMCGNAARCIAKYVFDNGLTDKRELTLDTPAGIKRLSLSVGADGLVDKVSVDMGKARIVQRNLILEAAGASFTGTVVDVGNPHFVIFCDDAEAIDLPTIGPAIERHPLFPGRINVEFSSLNDGSSLRMRVWERGSGITLACGTGASASVAAALDAGIVSCPCEVITDGGKLLFTVEAGNILMTGPARTVFSGTVEI